jgi:uncharacterized protein (DUF58 family)
LSAEILLLFLLLVIAAALLNGGFAFTVLYLFLGIYVVSVFWVGRMARNLSCKRSYETRVFCGEEIPVRLEIENRGWLPVPWLYLQESLPSELAAGLGLKRLLSLGPHGRQVITYTLHAYKRGYYSLGPLAARFGEPVGLSDWREAGMPAGQITVYPRIVPITDLQLPSRSPLGTLRHHQPIFADPTRVRGKRPYVAGDSLRHIDWKTSAGSGSLQVKQFEPSIALQTVLFLDLNRNGYPRRHGIDASELSIVIAASLANWVITKKQSVGLVTNGSDPLSGGHSIAPLPARKGKAQLIQVLDLLARLQCADSTPLAELIGRESANLPWGTTVAVITGQANEVLFDQIFQMKRHGLQVVLILAGRVTGLQHIRQQAERFGVPLHAFASEKSIEIWRSK